MKKNRQPASKFNFWQPATDMMSGLVFVDGKKVGDRYFAPGFTSYKHEMQYQVYDVTDMLTGNNTLTAVVAGGWAVGAGYILHAECAFGGGVSIFGGLLHAAEILERLVVDFVGKRGG